MCIYTAGTAFEGLGCASFRQSDFEKTGLKHMVTNRK